MKRREFINKSAMGAAALAAPFYFPSLSSERKLRIGLIGAGWYGMVDVRAAFKNGNVEVSGICDVDSEHLKTAADEIEKLQGYRPLLFKNFNDLIDLKGLEALFIATPPHWHALQFIAACRKGLDIYCEKPIAYDIREGQAMIAAANKTGNIVQIGFQRRNSIAFSKAKELIESGRIGDLRQIVAQINYNPVLEDTRIQPPPPSLDWDEWCGPAPMLDYRPNIGHKAWRLEKEYGNGHLVDWGIHHIDIIRRIMGEEMPAEFQTIGGNFVLKDKITTPDTLTAHMKFGKAPVTWQHRMWGNGDINPEFNNGIYFYGEKAIMFAQESKLVIFEGGRENKREDLMFPSPGMQETHVAAFLNSVRNKDRKSITVTPEDAFMSTATVQLAMIAFDTGSTVKWDLQKIDIQGNPEASKLLSRPYRARYAHP